jgi:hypothetical protein
VPSRVKRFRVGFKLLQGVLEVWAILPIICA